MWVSLILVPFQYKSKIICLTALIFAIYRYFGREIQFCSVTIGDQRHEKRHEEDVPE